MSQRRPRSDRRTPVPGLDPEKAIHSGPPEAPFGSGEPPAPSRKDGPPSRSAMKRAALALEALGKQLIALSDTNLARIPLPETLRDSILQARKITAFNALRRQTQHVGRLMRQVDAKPIAEALARIQGADDVERGRRARNHRRGVSGAGGS